MSAVRTVKRTNLATKSGVKALASTIPKIADVLASAEDDAGQSLVDELSVLPEEPLVEDTKEVPQVAKAPMGAKKSPAAPPKPLAGMKPKASPAKLSPADVPPKVAGGVPKPSAAKISVSPKKSAATTSVPAKTTPTSSVPKKTGIVSKAPAQVASVGKAPAPKTSGAKTSTLKKSAPVEDDEDDIPTRVVSRTPTTKPLASKSSKVVQKKVPKVKLEPRPYQVDWFNRITEILVNSNGYIDTSDPRTGKTLGAIYAFLFFKDSFKTMTVICPPGVVHVWETECAKYGVKVSCITSYNKLCSKRGSQPSCGLLTREEKETETGKHKVVFSITDEYQEILDNGTLLVFDEISKIKNLNDTEKACAALVYPIVNTETSSRFAFLSATPFETPKSAVIFLKMMGYIKHTDLYNTEKNGDLIFVGVKDLIDECRHFDKKKTKEIVDAATEAGFSAKPGPEMERLCYDLLDGVLKEHIAGYMTKPEDQGPKMTMRNGFFFISEGHDESLKKAIRKLSKAVDSLGGLDREQAIKQYAPAIEDAMLFDLARVIRDEMEADEKKKFIICLNYPGSVDDLGKLLGTYLPLTIHGKTPVAKRPAMYKKFNEDPSSRIIIMSTALTMGIALHDIKGDEPRDVYISPTHDLVGIAQAAKRAYGYVEGIEPTPVNVFIVYGKETGEEHIEVIEKILEGRKGNIRDSMSNDGQVRTKGPNDYERYVEDDGSNDVVEGEEHVEEQVEEQVEELGDEQQEDLAEVEEREKEPEEDKKGNEGSKLLEVD